MKELDVVLTRYLGGRWSTAGGEERAQFERILELPDPLLVAYLMGRERAPDQAMERLLDVLRRDCAGTVAANTLPTQSGS
jgi:antitoxin CptB